MRFFLFKIMKRNNLCINKLICCINDAKRKIGYLETKQDLMAILIIELARKIIKDLPSRVNASDEITELEFDKFMDSCSTEAKLTKNGFLDSLAMEIYERSAKGGD